MTELTGYQWDVIATHLGHLGVVAIFGGWAAAFIFRGFRD